jgi:hypothetical protein
MSCRAQNARRNTMNRRNTLNISAITAAALTLSSLPRR